MKPRLSRGFLTPQTNKAKKDTESKNYKETQNVADDLLFDKLMSCPIKRKLVLELIASEKDAIEEYKRKDAQKINSPINKIKKSKICESPTALLRRRALQQRNVSPSEIGRSRSSSDASRYSSDSESPIPFEKIFDGVIAYVEVRSKDKDRSSGVKIVLESMGATVSDTFTKNVTHVVFKDGSFTTYQKAKLLKKHLVSVLWVEFSRKCGKKQPEKNHPALQSGYDANLSILCSQMHKEYKDIIKEEYRHSIENGTSLPSTGELIQRRRTLMTPSTSSYHTTDSPASEFQENLLDKEVTNITSRFGNNSSSSSDGKLVLNSISNSSDGDSDSGAVANGAIKELSRRNNSDMDLTGNIDIITSVKATERSGGKYEFERDHSSRNGRNSSDTSKSSTNMTVSSIRSSDRSTNVSDLSVINREKLCVEKIDLRGSVSSENIFAIPKTSIKKKNVRSKSPRKSKATQNKKVSTEGAENIQLDSYISEKSSSDKTSSNMEISDSLQLRVSSDSTMPSLKLSVPLENSKQNSAQLSPKIPIDPEKSTSTTMSSLQVSPEKRLSKSTNSTTMSSLRISCSDKGVPEGSSISLSALCISSTQKGRDSAKSFSSDMSPYKLDSGVIDKALEAVRTPDYVTTRKRTVSKSADVSVTSDDDSEINIRSSKKSSQEIEKHNCSTSDNGGKSKVSKRENRKQINASNHGTNKHTIETDGQSMSDSDGGTKRTKRVRKLYNPDASFSYLAVSDERERQEKRAEIKNRKSDDGIILNPDLVSKKVLTENNKQEQTDEDDNIEIPKKPKKERKKKTKENHKAQSIDSSADEQYDLLKEIVHKKTDVEDITKKTPKNIVERRKSLRITQRSQKLRNSSTDDENNIMPITPIIRRSTLDFQSATQKSTTKKTKTVKPKLPTIVCTKLHKDEVQMFTKIAKRLGGFVVEDEVTNRTTHLVAGEPKRTINMLRAIARGCWVLKYKWVLHSLEAGEWLPEEDFEEVTFAPIVQQSRLQRQAFGPSYTLDVFQNCGPIYVSRGTNPRCSDLKELIITCSGKIVSSLRLAKIVVGEYVGQDDIVCVNETWVLDCITFNRTLPFKKKYTLCPSGRKSIIV